MKVSDIIIGPIIFGIGVIALIAASMQPKPFFGSGYGGGLFPSIVGSALIITGLMLALNGWRERGAQPLAVVGDWVRSPRHVANVAVVIAALVFYILLSNHLGFIVTGFISIYITLLQFTRAPLRTLIVSVVTILVVKLCFQDMLLVPLPWGVLEPYAGVLTWR